MPLQPEAQQSEYLKALCRMLLNANPTHIYQDSDAFYQLIYKTLWMHLEKQAGSHTELDIGSLFDITFDKFLRHLRDQRPKQAMLILAQAPKLFPPPKRGDAYTSDVKHWADASIDWTTREMCFCDTEDCCEQAINRLNKEMFPLKSQGDNLLAWLNCDADKMGTLPDVEEGEEDIHDESAPGANNKAEKSRRKELAKFAKAIAKLINSQGAAVADREIGMEHSAHFVVDMDEIIRALPMVQLPLEPYLKKIGTHVVIDMIRKLKSQGEFISLDDEGEEGEGGNSYVYRHENLQTSPIDNEPVINPRQYSEVEFTQFLKQWGAFIEKSKGLAASQRYENDADWQEGAELFRQTWQRLEKVQADEDAPLNRLEQIKACIIAPLQEAQMVFDYALMDYQNYEAVDNKPVGKLTKLKKALEDARKDLNDKLTDYDLNSRVLETMLEGFRKAAQDESDGGRLNKKGYTPEQIAEKLGLKNRDEVRASQEQMALLLVSLGPNQLRNKLINTQWEYLTGTKEEMGDAMPDLPKKFDSDDWIIVLQWLLPMLERQKEVASIEQQQAKETLWFLESCLIDRCRFNQPAFIEGELDTLLQQCTDGSAEQISKRYHVALDVVQSIFAQRLSVLNAISKAKSDWRKAHKRLTQIKEALNIFKNTRGTDE